jgi:hypothetical protein
MVHFIGAGQNDADLTFNYAKLLANVYKKYEQAEKYYLQTIKN